MGCRGESSAEAFMFVGFCVTSQGQNNVGLQFMLFSY